MRASELRSRPSRGPQGSYRCCSIIFLDCRIIRLFQPLTAYFASGGQMICCFIIDMNFHTKMYHFLLISFVYYTHIFSFNHICRYRYWPTLRGQNRERFVAWWTSPLRSLQKMQQTQHYLPIMSLMVILLRMRQACRKCVRN